MGLQIGTCLHRFSRLTHVCPGLGDCTCLRGFTQVARAYELCGFAWVYGLPACVNGASRTFRGFSFGQSITAVCPQAFMLKSLVCYEVLEAYRHVQHTCGPLVGRTSQGSTHKSSCRLPQPQVQDASRQKVLIVVLFAMIMLFQRSAHCICNSHFGRCCGMQCFNESTGVMGLPSSFIWPEIKQNERF